MASLKFCKTEYTKTDDLSAKHFFMKNPELKAMTFSYLQVMKLKHRYLLNAALTCKDFLHEALDALWKELYSLVPLLKLLPALQLEDEKYVLSGNVSQADLDRLQYYSRRVKFFRASREDHPIHPQVHPSTYFRIGQLQSSSLFPSLRQLHYYLDDSSISHIFLFLSPVLDLLDFDNIGGFENTSVGPFLATLSSPMLRRVVLRNGQMSVDILKKSIVHFKQLRSLELINAVLMSDSVLWEVLGTLPSLAYLSLVATDPASYPAHAPENSVSRSGGPMHFDALESLSVKGSFFLILHLLCFIDSPSLKSIKITPVAERVRDEDDEDLFTPTMTIATAKWSQSLKSLLIISSSSYTPQPHTISKCLILLMDLHKMKTFRLGWRLKDLYDDVIGLVMSWPKLKTLNLNQTIISLSTLRTIAETCPELRHLHIRLDTSTIPPFDTSNSKSLRHNLEILTVGKALPSPTTQKMLEYQIQATRHIDLIFPYLKSIEVTSNDVFWSGIRDLVHLCKNASLSRG